MNYPYLFERGLNSLMAEVDRRSSELYLGHEGWFKQVK